MSNYTKNNNFTSFDGTGKVISGVEFDSEFDEIATAIATKLDTSTFNAANLGKVLQVVYANAPDITTTVNSAAYIDSAYASITPSAASSKIFVIGNPYLVYSRSNANQAQCTFYIDRDGSSVSSTSAFKIQDTYLNAGFIISPSIHYLDSPATTSSVTYTIKVSGSNSNGSFFSYPASSITLMEIAA
jgi:hypothetical protein